MKNFFKFYVILTSILFIGAFCVSQNIIAANGGGGGGGCVSSPTPGTTVPASGSDTITLSSGWNIVSTPKVLTNHQFSSDETSANFDILLLDPTATSGWQTMQGVGQTEFQPLFAYFINNKTGTSQTLTFNYNLNLSPAQRLFQRTLQPGWNGIGIALPDSTIRWAHQNPYSDGVSAILNQINSSALTTIDFTANQSDPNSVGISSQWNVRASLGANDVSSLQNLKGYGAYITQATGSFIGYENLSETAYTLIYSAGANGSITGNASQTVYAGLNSTAVTAVPDSGYQFTDWSDCSTQNPRTDTGIQSGINVTANFSVATSSATAVLQTATLSPAPLIGSQTNHSIDPQTNYAVWSENINITSDNVRLTKLSLKGSGSINPSDLQNFCITTIAHRFNCSNGADLDANGNAAFDFSTDPLYLPTGINTITVYADIIGGTGKTFSLSLQNASDITLVDQNNIDTPVSLDTGDFSPQTTGLSLINSGIITIQQIGNLSGGRYVTYGATNVDIEDFTITAVGEPVKISSLGVDVGGATIDGLKNGALYADGIRIGNTADLIGRGGTIFNLGSLFIVTPGTPVTLSIKADISDINTTGGGLSVGDDFWAGLLSGTGGNAQGQISLTTFNTPRAGGTYLTVQGGGLTLAKDVSYTDQTITVPQSAYKLAQFNLTATGNEAININNIQVDLNSISSNTSNLYVVYGSQQTTIQLTANATNNFSVNYLLSVGRTITVAVYGDIDSLATETGVASILVSGTTATTLQSINTGIIAGQNITLGVQ